MGYLALGCYVVLCVAFLGVRHWVLPNIDQWREPLQRQLSSLLSLRVTLGSVAADWRGVHPRFKLTETTLRDERGRTLLQIPALDVVVAWHSLLTGDPEFLGFRADGVELTIRRDLNGRMSLLGQSLEASDGSGEEAPDVDMLGWLSRQGPIQFTNASVRWMDAQRGAPPLSFSRVSLRFAADGPEYAFSMRAVPPAELGTGFSMQGRMSASAVGPGSALSLDHVSGLVHVHVEDMQPAAWSPWLDIQSVLDQGRVSWAAWQAFTDGVLGQHVSLVDVSDGVWKDDMAAEVRAASAGLYLAGPWAALNALWAPAASDALASGDAERSLRVVLRAQGLSVSVPEAFQRPLTFDDIAVSTDVGRDGTEGVYLERARAQVRNADMDLDLTGGWREQGGGEAGLIDVEGVFRRAELAAIVRYLPAMVGEEAREWLEHGLLAGRLTDAELRLRGDLVHFPFGDQPDAGDFYVGGPVSGAVIDYAPAAAVGPPGWPRLERLEGHAQLHRVDLKVRAEHMQMRPAGQTIALRDVHAHIANIERDSVLEVSGVGRADAAAFVALIQTSPLDRLLDGLFAEARGEGQWEVPIALTIPLLDTDATKVAGSVVFDQAALSVSDDFPALSGLTGTLSFTEEALTADGVTATALGGPVTLSGGVGKDYKGLVFEGKLTAGGLVEFLGAELKGVAKGATSYRLALQRTAGGAYGMRLDSPLEGMGIELPAPVGKPAGQRLPLRVQWTPAGGKSDAVLEFRLGEHLAGRLLHREGRKGGTFFHSGVVNVQGKASPVAGGLAIDVQAPRIDIDAWRELGGRYPKGGGAAKDTLFPPLRDLRLQSEQARVFGMDLEHFTFTARRSPEQRWRVDVSSTETAGTLFWQERQGRIQGNVEARFERLTLGAASDAAAVHDGSGKEEAFGLKPDDDIDIPAIQLKVDRLRLYGHDVGAVSVVGVNEAQGRVWRLDQLEVQSPHGGLTGSGTWRLAGPQRGFSLQAHARFDDLGAYLNQAGFPDLLEGGEGEIEGHIEWRNVPWRFERSALQGDLRVDLGKGRLLNLGSRSARLLELLSLQSVRRLATMEWNPAGLIKQGFPFDTMQGHLIVKDGVLHSENYRIVGPVGTIIIAGDADLPKEALDLYAVVVPNLDVSGAAIAAGIAVNPIVGLGAFVTQWLLKDPLAKAMAVEYRIKGSFDEPQINAVTTTQDAR